MNVSLTAELNSYVLAKVETGRYNSASEVLREALRLMQERDEIRELHIAEARLKIQSGLDALASGLYAEDTEAGQDDQAIQSARRRMAARDKAA